MTSRTLTGWICPAVPVPFPADLIEPSDSPNIYVTSPTMTVPSHAYPPPSGPPSPSMQSLSTASLHSLSPGSSPTAPDFPAHIHTHPLPHQHTHQQHQHQHPHHHHHSHHHSPHTLSRQHSFQHPYADPHLRYDAPLATPLPPSPGPGGAVDFDYLQGRKRQRTGPAGSLNMSISIPGGMNVGMPGSVGVGVGVGVGGVNSANQGEAKRLSRARSDSAPLGYGIGSNWGTTRPRSGSGLAPRREEGGGGVPSMGGVARQAGAPVKGEQQQMVPLTPGTKPSPGP